jgi:LacI family transcriptional regulator
VEEVPQRAVRPEVPAQDAAWAQDKILLVVNTKGNPAIESAAVETLLARKVDGIIYATMYHRPVQPPAALHEVPTVLLDCFSEDRSFPSVVPDEVGGGRAATEYLLNKGHRRVAFINHPHKIPATFGRLQGHRQALADFGVPFDEALVCSENAESEGGYKGTMKLMQLSDPPTAIFCFNDRTAMGAYDALRKLGRSIPDDVAVVGFDNLELIAAHLYPPLTTMQLPHYAMGEWAVGQLARVSQEAENSAPIQHQIECPLVERESA